MRPSVMRLEDVRIASPCPASWAEMEGNDRRRFCGQCRLHVYNLSAMTREQATRFLQEQEGRICVRLYRRVDGTVLTRDCPVGFQRVQRNRLGKLAAALVIVSSMAYWVLVALLTDEGPIARLFDRIREVPGTTMGGVAPMGRLVSPDR